MPIASERPQAQRRIGAFEEIAAASLERSRGARILCRESRRILDQGPLRCVQDPSGATRGWLAGAESSDRAFSIWRRSDFTPGDEHFPASNFVCLDGRRTTCCSPEQEFPERF